MSVKSLIDFFNPYKEVYSLSAEKKKAWAEGALWMFCYLVACIRNKKRRKKNETF